ncbi:cytochrome c oxidase assembly protein [Roseateles depolymerans]|uniref:Cytochrome c oxidase assembly protein CtaG n=1 Tax=Roseateles depolymerans TaxID=76731 RepID=A0A0U3N2Z8_9BURK|nr:cytochrome c oxidase assembly protein [Roseateles depolymerans]ALV08548.1 cytochrome C oxidase assembly protein [Roseateles depolymerans]REG21226.1 cytochrome c oxidase assembly protein subunit 11 [Roseateles depolymerans]
MDRRPLAAWIRRDNLRMTGKLLVVVAMMAGFGYALVPIYRAVCTALGINVLALGERQHAVKKEDLRNTQVDYSRRISVEFDTNARGPWDFKPAVRHMDVHPGELTTVMYTFQNVQNRVMAAQAIPSYAPKQATPYFNKLECFCFNEYTLQPGEQKVWPVVFVIDPKLPRDVKTITLSYTFFEIPGKGGSAVKVQAQALPVQTPGPVQGRAQEQGQGQEPRT